MVAFIVVFCILLIECFQMDPFNNAHRPHKWKAIVCWLNETVNDHEFPVDKWDFIFLRMSWTQRALIFYCLVSRLLRVCVCASIDDCVWVMCMYLCDCIGNEFALLGIYWWIITKCCWSFEIHHSIFIRHSHLCRQADVSKNNKLIIGGNLTQRARIHFSPQN